MKPAPLRMPRAWAVVAIAAVAALGAVAPSRADGAADRHAEAGEPIDQARPGTAPADRVRGRIPAGATMGRLIGDVAAARPPLPR
jgi:hypothetical protein